MYVNEYRNIYPMASDITVDRQIEHDFFRWFTANVSTNTTGFFFKLEECDYAE